MWKVSWNNSFIFVKSANCRWDVYYAYSRNPVCKVKYLLVRCRDLPYLASWKKKKKKKKT